MAEQRLIDANAEAAWAMDNLPEPHSGVVIQFLRGCGTIDPETLHIVRQLREELEKVTAERDALLKEIAGECGLCANYENCKKYPVYCINGNMWEWCGTQAEEEEK